MSSNLAFQTAELDQDSFNYLRQKLFNLAGIHLADSKFNLVTGRIRPRLAKLGFSTFREYVGYIDGLPAKDPEWEFFVNQMTTNKTDFFREEEHFNFLTQKLLPEWRKAGKSSFQFWSSACSTGEEPYTLSMVLKNAQNLFPFEYKIAASDIDTKVIATAKSGVYAKDRIKEVPTIFHKSAFAFGTKGIENWVKVKTPIKASVEFKQCNLLKPPFPWANDFDVIFCRNVLIYFKSDTVQQVARNLYEAAKPGAYLFIGHSETLNNIKTEWEHVHPAVYRKRGR